MFENPRRGRQARNFATNLPKILDLKSSSEQIFFRKLSLGAPEFSSICKSTFKNVLALHVKVKFDKLFECAAISTFTIDFKLADIKRESSEANLLKLEKNLS